MSDAKTIPVCFTGGPLNSCSLPTIPVNARILYTTFDASNRESIRWAAWTTDQPPGTIPSLVVDPGESVFVYKIAPRVNPFVKFKDGEGIKDALLFEFWGKGDSVKETLAEGNGAQED